MCGGRTRVYDCKPGANVEGARAGCNTSPVIDENTRAESRRRSRDSSFTDDSAILGKTVHRRRKWWRAAGESCRCVAHVEGTACPGCNRTDCATTRQIYS